MTPKTRTFSNKDQLSQELYMKKTKFVHINNDKSSKNYTASNPLTNIKQNQFLSKKMFVKRKH